ncbi:MAG: FMN-binding negative transcriptional regulator, partial [Acidimicrobiales bacterium]
TIDNTSPGFQATALPFLVDDGLSIVRAHVARANPQWRTAADATALLIVPVSDAYISPRWYPSKREHGRVVPTWNYEVVHLHGTIEVHDDEAWLRRLVSDLTDHNEQQVTEDDGTPAWHVDDAPLDFIDKQLRAIVGLELHVSRIEAKQKLSQNRDEPDRQGAAGGLGASNRRHDRQTSAAMSRLESDGP